MEQVHGKNDGPGFVRNASVDSLPIVSYSSCWYFVCDEEVVYGQRHAGIVRPLVGTYRSVTNY